AGPGPGDLLHLSGPGRRAGARLPPARGRVPRHPPRGGAVRVRDEAGRRARGPPGGPPTRRPEPRHRVASGPAALLRVRDHAPDRLRAVRPVPPCGGERAVVRPPHASGPSGDARPRATLAGASGVPGTRRRLARDAASIPVVRRVVLPAGAGEPLPLGGGLPGPRHAPQAPRPRARRAPARSGAAGSRGGLGEERAGMDADRRGGPARERGAPDDAAVGDRRPSTPHPAAAAGDARVSGGATTLSRPLEAFYGGKTVLVTGHTGFKGSWLATWLTHLGARVVGYALPPPTEPSHFEACRLATRVVHVDGDVRDYEALERACREHRPEIVLHLAAQSLVRRAFAEPRLT